MELIKQFKESSKYTCFNEKQCSLQASFMGFLAVPDGSKDSDPVCFLS